MKIIRALTAWYNILRFTKERAIRHSIKAKFKEFISPNAEISIRGNGELILGHSVLAQRGVLLGVRQNAKLEIGDNVGINRNTCIVARERIVIERNVIIAPNVCIFDHDHIYNKRDKYVTAPIIIKENTWIAANSVILKGVTIGKNCTIAAGSVITHDIPDNTIVYQKRVDTLVNR